MAAEDYDDAGRGLEDGAHEDGAHEDGEVNGTRLAYVQLALTSVTALVVVVMFFGTLRAHVNDGYIHQGPEIKRAIAASEATKAVQPVESRLNRLEDDWKRGVLPVAAQRLDEHDRRLANFEEFRNEVMKELSEIKALIKDQR